MRPLQSIAHIASVLSRAILNAFIAEVAYGCVAELVYAYVSETYGEIREGSNPSAPTLLIIKSLPAGRQALFGTHRNRTL